MTEQDIADVKAKIEAANINEDNRFQIIQDLKSEIVK